MQIDGLPLGTGRRILRGFPPAVLLVLDDGGVVREVVPRLLYRVVEADHLHCVRHAAHALKTAQVTLVVKEWPMVMIPELFCNDDGNLYMRSPVVAGTLNDGFVAAEPAGVKPGSVRVTVSGEPPAFLTCRISPAGSAVIVSDAATAV
jgi:hypothetical protein